LLAKLDIRRFLRPKDDEWGSDSTIRVECSVDKQPARTREDREIPPRGVIIATFSLRDCSESISIDFSASRKKKHAMHQFGVLCNIIRDLESLRLAYSDAIDELTNEGYLK
jgi:hypothetical protein